MDRGAWWAIVHRVAKSQARLKQFSMGAHTHTNTHILITIVYFYNLLIVS